MCCDELSKNNEGFIIFEWIPIPVACSGNWKLVEKLPYKAGFFREIMGAEMFFLTYFSFFTVLCVFQHHRPQEAKNYSVSPGFFSPLLNPGEGSLRFPQNV